MMMTTWGHHHHHHHCEPLLAGWMGEDEKTRGRSNNDKRGGHPRWRPPHAYEQLLVGWFMGETNLDRGARPLGDDWGRDKMKEGMGQE